MFTGDFNFILVFDCKIHVKSKANGGPRRKGDPMSQQQAYRHELKYRISRADYYAIRQRIQPVMRPDAHVRPDGCYLIRSIYFDNYKDKALREKRCGMQQREKFRIRYYNDDLSHISLEKKIKHNSLCMKLDAPLTEAECRSLLAGPAPWMASHPNSLVRELYCKMRYQQLRPRVLVSYRREPYVYAAGNVRVTFDSCIRTSLFRRPLLDGGAQDISAMDAPEELLLEVKYDAFLPDVIASLLQTGTVRQQAFSKYGASRRFG